MASTKTKSQKIWKMTEEQKSHLTEMLKNAGFSNPIVINKMIQRICTSKTKTGQAIMTRWLNNRAENGVKKWMDDFLFRFRSSGISRTELIDIISSNSTLLFSKVETLYGHAKDFQDKLKSSEIDLSDKVAFDKNVFKTGLLSRSPVTLARNVKNLIKVFEKRGVSLDQERFVRRVLKECPALFMQRPSTIASNMDQTVRRLRSAGYPISKEQYAKACYSQVRLSYSTPDRICKNFESLYAFIEQEHCRLAQDVRKDIKTPENIVCKILADPAHLGSGEESLKNRWLLACQLEEERGYVATYSQINAVKKDDVQQRLSNYRCPLQRIVDNLRQRT